MNAPDWKGLLADLRGVRKSEYQQFNDELATLYADAFGLLSRLEVLPNTDESDRAVERLSDAVIAIEDAQSAFEKFYYPQRVPA